MEFVETLGVLDVRNELLDLPDGDVPDDAEAALGRLVGRSHRSSPFLPSLFLPGLFARD